MSVLSNAKPNPLWQLRARKPVLWLTLTAMFMAVNIALSSFGIPVPGGHLYLCDIAICLAALLLDPLGALLVGGVGSFLGDFFFYPAPMFVSLVTHGIQALVISLCAGKIGGAANKAGAAIGLILGVIIMVAGYTFGRAYVYATPEYAIIKLPYEILQGALGAVIAPLLCYKCGLKKHLERIILK